MNAFNLAIVILTIGIVVIASLCGICSVVLDRRWPNRLTSTLQEYSESDRPCSRLCSAVMRLSNFNNTD
jgi:hypothetical protein